MVLLASGSCSVTSKPSKPPNIGEVNLLYPCARTSGSPVEALPDPLTAVNEVEAAREPETHIAWFEGSLKSFFTSSSVKTQEYSSKEPSLAVGSRPLGWPRRMSRFA